MRPHKRIITVGTHGSCVRINQMNMKKKDNTEEKKDNRPRGLRNCNPGNIILPPEERMDKDKFYGELRPSRDPKFRTFINNAYGYRAMHYTLRRYKNQGINTMAQMINRWCPPSDKRNKTDVYIEHVEQWSGIGRDQIVDVSNMTIMCRLVAAMSRQENGVPADMNEVQDGWTLL